MDSHVEDVDIVRPPAMVRSCTAAACAAVVGKPGDPFGIAPSRDVLPDAPFYGFITDTDSHAVNKLVSKWISARVDSLNVYLYGTLTPAAPAARVTRPGAVGTPSTASAGVTTQVTGHADGGIADALPVLATVPGYVPAPAVPTVSPPRLTRERAAAPDHTKPFFCHIPSFCIQHKTGNVVEDITKFLGLIGPSFCLASTLSHGDSADELLQCINDYIARNLVPRDPADLHFSAADERDLKFQEEMLERCYVQDTGRDREGKLKVGVDKRREEAEHFLRFFGAPWSDKWGIVHPCPAGRCGKGACADRDKSVERA